MPLDPHARRFLNMMAIAPASKGRPPLAKRRKALEKLMRFAQAERLCDPGTDGAFDTPAGALRYRLYKPTSAKDGLAPGLLFFHGGGMVAGSIDTHDLVCRALCEESGCATVSIDYRLAPEHSFPAAVDDAIAATFAVAKHGKSLGIDMSRLCVGGDSAGATLAATVCQQGRGQIPAIALQFLICPVLDFGELSASRKEFTEGYLIDRTTLEADFADYCPPDIDRSDQRISPLRIPDCRGLPPAIIHTAEFDPLRDEGDAYARKLAAAVNVTHVRHSGMVHNFHALGAVLPQGRAVLKQIGTQIREGLGG